MNNTEIRSTLKKMMRFSQPQLDYVKAKAIYDTVYPDYMAAISPVYDLSGKIPENELIDKMCEVDNKYNWSAITTNKLNSQKALIEWGRDVIKAHHPADFQKVAKIYENDEYLCHPDVYEKLINLTMNLDVNKGVKV